MPFYMDNVPDDWFRHWFDEKYLQVYSHRDESEAREFINSWQIWDRISEGDLCLDLGCGEGRYCRELSTRGLKVCGIDLSTPLLKLANQSNNKPENPYYVRADLRALPLAGSFDLIISLFTSFGYFAEDVENKELLESISSYLSEKGVFILDIPNPSFVKQRVNESPVTHRVVDEMQISEHRMIDRIKQRVMKQIDVVSGEGEKTYYESVRLFTDEEIKSMFSEAGLKLIDEVRGDYDGASLSNESSRMIYFSSHDG